MEIPEDDLEAILSLIPRLVGAFQRRTARNLASDGLTIPQFVTLHVLEQADGHCSMGPLAAAAMQSPAAMTGIVDRLLERGLVRRERHPEDRRSVVVQLTEPGRDLLERARENRLRWERLLLGSLSPQEQRALRAVLDKMIGLLDAGADS